MTQAQQLFSKLVKTINIDYYLGKGSSEIISTALATTKPKIKRKPKNGEAK